LPRAARPRPAVRPRKHRAVLAGRRRGGRPVSAATVATRAPAVTLTEASSGRGRPRRRRLPRSVRRAAGPLLLLAVWQALGTAGIVDDRTLAPPVDVVRAGWELASTGELAQHLWVSLRRVVTGLAVGVTAGVALALLAGLFRWGEDVLGSALQVLRAVPGLGLLPPAILRYIRTAHV